MKPKIERAEFLDRIRKTQELMKQQGIDLLFAYGNEAEPQFIRYYSNYWPNFELDSGRGGGYSDHRAGK